MKSISSVLMVCLTLSVGPAVAQEPVQITTTPIKQHFEVRATLAASTASVITQEGMPAASQPRFSRAETSHSLGVQLAQTSNWSAVQALISGQKIQVTAQGKEVTAEFQSATERQLVITRGGAIVYVDRPDVQQVAYTVRDKYSTKWMWIGIAVGAPWGLVTVQGGGYKGIPITMGIFGGLGALRDYHRNSHNQQHVVVVYRSVP